MLFTNPLILWGLLAVSIPIIIHLFNFQRYKKVYFTNVRFLQQLQQQSRRQSVLRHWLALLFRILAIAFLVLAFAKPYIPSTLGSFPEASGAVGIYIDNSFSMETEGYKGFLIDEALDKAKDIVANHSRSDKFNLLTNDFMGIHHRLVAGDELVNFLDQTEISPSVKNIAEVLSRQYDILNRDHLPNKTVYLISDFQHSISTLDGFAPDTNIRHFFVRLEPAHYSNLSIDSCWFEIPAQQPGQIAQIYVKVTNHSDVAREKIPLKLVINGSQRALTSIDLEPGGSTTTMVSFTIRETGIHEGFFEINDYPVTFDDRLYISFRVLEKINILGIFDQKPGPYLQALFGSDTLFRYTEINLKQLNFADLQRQELIVLNGLNDISSGLATELNRFIENGGSVFVIPAEKIDNESYSNWMRSLNTVSFAETDTARLRVSDLNLLHPLFKDVFENQSAGRSLVSAETDLPWVNLRYGLSFPARKDIQTLMSLKNSAPFLIADRHGEGMIYVLSSPLDIQATTFPVHAIFVPVLYRMALLSTSHQDLYSVIGVGESVNIGNINPGNSQVFQLSDAGGQFRFIPGHRTVNYNTHLFALNAINKAGNYTLTSDSDTLLVLSFNYDRRESLPDYLSEDELENLAKSSGITNFAVVSESERPIGQVISELSRGKQLWKYFIIASLAFILAEIVVLRFLP